MNLNLKLGGIILECFYLTMTENKLWVMVYQLIICKAAVDCLRILCILLPGPAFVTALSAEWVILLEDGK